MSYIRGITNPEALYIWHDTEDGLVHWTWNVPRPLSNGQGFEAPLKDFYLVALRYAASFDMHAAAGDFSAREQHVYLATGRRVGASKRSAWFRSLHNSETCETAYLVRVQFKAIYVNLWPVTWEYVVRSVADHEAARKDKS